MDLLKITVTGSDNNISDTIINTQTLNTKYRPSHVRSGNYMIWYDLGQHRDG